MERPPNAIFRVPIRAQNLYWVPETESQREERREALFQIDALLYAVEECNVHGEALPGVLLKLCHGKGVPHYMHTGPGVHDALLHLQVTYLRQPLNEYSLEMALSRKKVEDYARIASYPAKMRIIGGGRGRRSTDARGHRPDTDDTKRLRLLGK